MLTQGSVEEIRSQLFGQRTLVARVVPEDAEIAEEAIRTVSGVEAVDVERDRLRISFEGDDAASAQLLAAVVAAGTRVVEWRVEGAGLEELFLRLTDDGDGAPA